MTAATRIREAGQAGNASRRACLSCKMRVMGRLNTAAGSMWRDAGSATFQYPPVNREASLCGMAYGDFDRDGDSDIVIVDHAQPARLHLFVNDGLLGCQEIGAGYRTGQEAVAHFALGDFATCDIQVVLPFGKGVVRRFAAPADRLLIVA